MYMYISTSQYMINQQNTYENEQQLEFIVKNIENQIQEYRNHIGVVQTKLERVKQERDETESNSQIICKQYNLYGLEREAALGNYGEVKRQLLQTKSLKGCFLCCRYTALMYAVLGNHIDCAKLLLEEAGMQNDDGDTALILAIKNKNEQMIQLLAPLEKNIKNKQGDSPLDLLSKFNFSAQTTQYFENVEQYYCGFTELMMQALRRNNDALIETKKKNYNQIKQQEKLEISVGYTALMYAVVGLNFEGVNELVEEAGIQNKDGETALLIAIQNEKKKPKFAEKVIEILAPKEKHITNKYGLLPVFEALRVGNCDSLKFLTNDEYYVANNYNISSLMIAAAAGDSTCVKKYIMQNQIKQQGQLKGNVGYTALMYASLGSHVDCAKLLLEEAGMQNDEGDTALMLAIQKQNDDIVQLLAAEEKNIYNYSGENPFQIAYKYGFQDYFEILSNGNENIEWNEISALMLAAKCGNLKKVKELKKSQIQQQSDMCPNAGYTALMYAAIGNHTDCIEELLEEVGMQDQNGDTALIHAIRNGSISSIQILAPKEKFIFNILGESPFSIALQNQQLYCLNSLYDSNLMSEAQKLSKQQIEAKFYVSQLMMAASIGNYHDVESLKNSQQMLRGSLPFQVGYTSLMYAALGNHVDCAQLLIQEAGMQDDKGNTAMIIAVEHCKHNKSYKQVAKLLAEREQSIANLRGDSPISIAFNNKMFKMFDIFINKETSVQSNGVSVLMLAASTGKTSIIRQYLIEQIKQQAQIQNYTKYTALMYAVLGNHIDCAELLLEEAGMQNDDGDTALILAIKNKNKEMVQLLAPFEKSIKNSKNGKYALELLCQYFYSIDLAQLLIIEELTIEKSYRTEIFQTTAEQNLKFHDPHNNTEYSIIGKFENQQKFTRSSVISSIECDETIQVETTILRVCNNDKFYCCKFSVFKAERMSRCVKELEVFSMLQHKNIIQLKSSVMLFDQDMFCYAFSIMEEGFPMFHFFSQKIEKFLMLHFIQLACDLCEGIIYLHSQYIIHRDIKPDNILIVKDISIESGWIAKIIDFDASQYIGQDQWNYLQLSKPVGTPGFMAPELCKNNVEYNYKCDIYSLGISLDKVSKEYFTRENQEKIQHIIQGMMNRNPSKRIPLIAAIQLFKEIKE